MIIVGIDPSLRNFGLVKAELLMEGGNTELRIVDMVLVETSPTKNKKIRKNSDDLERFRDIHSTMSEFTADAKVVFAEVPHGSQSSRSAISQGACGMCLATLEQPLIQVTAKEVKQVTGLNNATKDEMIAWATKRYPTAPWLGKGKTILKKNEHLADAIASIEAGIESEQFRSALVLLKAMAA